VKVQPQITKKMLLNMISELEKNPRDRFRILGDAGVTLVGIGLGAAAAGTLATATGATSIFGLTTVASWLGITAVAATPIGWVLGTAALGGAVAYGVSRMIHGGGLSEGRKSELLQQYREDAREMEVKEQAGSISDDDKTKFIIAMRELIENDAIAPERAKALIEHVENGRVPLAQAFELIQSLLSDEPAKQYRQGLS